MFSSLAQKLQPVAFAAVACLMVSGHMLAQDATVRLPNVTYTAQGTFSASPVSGNDLYKLAGQPFIINIVANEATKPQSHGNGYGVFTGLKMKGKVNSALLSTPVTIESAHAFLELAIGNPNYDVFVMAAPVVVLKKPITIKANLQLAHGTMTKWLIYPFSAPATLSPASGQVSYSANGATTVLTIANGTLNAVKGAK